VVAPGSGSAWEAAVRELRADATRQALVRDAYYDDPAIHAAMRYWGSEEWRAIRRFMPGGHCRVLDLGAGRGIASYALAKDGHRVCALEPDPSALVGAAAIRELAQVAGIDIAVCEGHSEALPFPDESFDVVFARAVLHHARDLHALCRESFRVLRPRGRIIAVREHVISSADDLPAFLAAHPLHRYYGGENAYVLGYYRAAFRSAGFDIRSILAPLASAINYAPHTLATMKRELARIVAAGVPGLESVVYTILRLPGVWQLIRPGLQLVDARPGRLYSFVACKP